MSNSKRSRALGFTPSRTVLDCVQDMLGRLPLGDPNTLGTLVLLLTAG